MKALVQISFYYEGEQRKVIIDLNEVCLWEITECIDKQTKYSHQKRKNKTKEEINNDAQ